MGFWSQGCLNRVPVMGWDVLSRARENISLSLKRQTWNSKLEPLSSNSERKAMDARSLNPCYTDFAPLSPAEIVTTLHWLGCSNHMHVLPLQSAPRVAATCRNSVFDIADRGNMHKLVWIHVRIAATCRNIRVRRWHVAFDSQLHQKRGMGSCRQMCRNMAHEAQEMTVFDCELC